MPDLAQSIFLPPKPAVVKCFELTQSDSDNQANEYFIQQLEQRIDSNPRAQGAREFLIPLKEIVDNMGLQKDRSNPWEGEMPNRSGFENLQRNVSQDSAKAIIDELAGKSVKIDYAIETNFAQLVRGFSSEGAPLDPALQKKLDYLLNAWLAEKQVVNDESVLYQADSKGQTVTDKAGKPSRADAERIRQLIEDKQEGLAKFYADRGVKVQMQQRPFPPEYIKADVTEGKPVAQQPAARQEAGQTPAEPEAPTASSGGMGR
ncbi:hypothetical protein ACFORL_08435 [Legionella dresdenensis]|uniref:Substrate of the Dot/Icm secretion system n=1 Tax=Legionella dresdenensis TaxID=450200 RepID=A0ABV8CFK4_9GAMM